MLASFLKEKPNDAFARYGLAMEYSRTGNVEAAVQQFEKLLESHPDYIAGYFMAAQALAKAGRNEEARDFLAKGIGAASRTGNVHARGEMEALLAELG